MIGNPRSSLQTTEDSLADLSPDQQRALLSKLLKAKAEQAKKFPMSEGQQGLWHAYRRDPNCTSFNVFLPTRICSRLQTDALRKSIALILQRHSSLRATFSDAGGELTQEIADQVEPDFEVAEHLGASDEEIRTLLADELQRPFDLEAGPLLRMRVYKVAEENWIILAATHHIVVDFWSLVLILDELRSVYPDYADGKNPGLRAASNNYSDFVRNQQRLFSSPTGQKLKAYWQQHLEGVSPIVEIATDYLRPAKFSGDAAVVPLSFGPDISRRLTRFASEHRSTSVTVIQSVLQVLIGCYSGQKQFAIGSPFVGRNQQKFEETVGFFVNMLPNKANLEGDPSFGEIVSRATRTLVSTLENQEYPISRIVHDQNIPRDPSRSPLFQISCTFEKAHLKSEAGRGGFLFPGDKKEWSFGGMRQESFYLPHPTCHYDLEFILEQTDDELRGMICYCSDLFVAETVHQIASNFSRLTDNLLESPDTPISFSAWDDSLRHAQLASCRIEHPQTQSTVDGLILDAAGQDPQRIAMQADQQQVTYGDLVRDAQDLSVQLIQQGVGSQDLVPVVASQGPQAFLGMLAVHLAGAAFVPMDTTQPTCGLREVVSDVSARLLLADAGAEAECRSVGEIPTLRSEFGTSASELARSKGPVVGLQDGLARPSNPAYVVYTSGSTGKPKGVLLEHQAVCNTLHWRLARVPLRCSDRVLMLLSHQFDAGLGIAWTTLTQGATLIWADHESQTDPSALIDQIIREEITVLPAVPSLLQALIAHPGFANCKTVRYVWTGGEVMPPELAEQIRAVSHARVWNFYGPTEAAIEATACDVTHHVANRPVPIGKEIANTRVLILDDHQRPVPDTVPGEIAISGAGLARGYLNDSELTDKKFVVLDMPSGSGCRFYLTGDRGRRNGNGEIEFLGRSDHQVKLRGYRIELGEIESWLHSHELVERAAVKLIGHGAQAKLLAFVRLRSGPSRASEDSQWSHETESIQRFLATRLPAYKLPSALIALDELPMTASGKVDRKRLPNTLPANFLEKKWVPSDTDIERYLVEVWCDLLDVEQVSVHQNFFDAGGSSLQAAMLTNKLAEDLGVPVPTALVFDLADIVQIAQYLVRNHRSAMVARFGSQSVEQQCLPFQLPQGDGDHKVVHPLLVPLKSTGTRRSIFMVHPPGGIVICYRELARKLPTDLPLVGIRCRGLHGRDSDEANMAPSTMQEMAQDYVCAIRSVQPEGPYSIGGWSLGGLVAYEMSRQLVEDGEQVAQIVLLDTTIPAGATRLVPEVEQVNVGLEYGIELTLDELSQLAPEEQLPFLWEHAKKLGVLQDESTPEVVAQTLEELQGLFHEHVTLASQYQMEPTDVPIVLVRPTDVPCELPVRRDRGWGYLSPTVEVHFVSGHHHSMVQNPHVEAVAEILGKLRT